MTTSQTLLPNLERDVLTLLAQGYRDQEVAARLGLENAKQACYRVDRIKAHLGLEAATRPQLVDAAYTRGALPAPDPIQPLVLEAAQYHLVRMIAAGATIGEYAGKRKMTRSQANSVVRKTQGALEAATLPALIREAWRRQILGPTLFAADLQMHSQQEPEPGLGGHVIVPLASGHRLALPAWGLRPTRYLDVPDETEAQAAARFLSARDGYAQLRITPPEHQGGPFRVSWRRQEAMPSSGHSPVLGRSRNPPVYRGRSA